MQVVTFKDNSHLWASLNMHRYKVLERTCSIHVLLNTQMQHQLFQARKRNILLGKYRSMQEGKESLSSNFKEHEIMNKELSSLSWVI